MLSYGIISQTLQSLSNIAANAQTNPSPSNANGIFYSNESEYKTQCRISSYVVLLLSPINKYSVVKCKLSRRS